MKVVINTCHGGFGLSLLALHHYEAAIGGPVPKSWNWDAHRDDPELVRVVELLGEKASSLLAYLEVVEIPDGIEWKIDEYDGWEHVAEKHRTWP